MGIRYVPPGVVPGAVARMAARVHASSTSSVVAAPQIESRNSRRLIPARRALRSQASLARRTVSRRTGGSGSGSYSAFEQGPSLMGSPGSSSFQSFQSTVPAPMPC